MFKFLKIGIFFLITLFYLYNTYLPIFNHIEIITLIYYHTRCSDNLWLNIKQYIYIYTIYNIYIICLCIQIANATRITTN